MSSFLKFIDEARMAIQLGSKYLEGGSISVDKAANIKESIVYNSLRITIALYSSNAGKDEISKNLIENISAFENGFKWEGFENSYAMYDQIIWLLSLSILCDIDNADFERIVKIIKRDNATDKLIAKLVNYKLPNSIQGFSSDYIQESPYANLDMVVSGTDPTAFAIKNYLEKEWYKGHSDAPWHDTHKNKRANVYFGYWAWETAALVKIYSIDDSMLRDQQYYPYRALHWDEPPTV